MTPEQVACTAHFVAGYLAGAAVVIWVWFLAAKSSHRRHELEIERARNELRSRNAAGCRRTSGRI